MKHPLAFAGLALAAACAASMAPSVVSPAEAGGWHRWDRYGTARPYRRAYRTAPRYDNENLRYYNSPRAYRSACGYGDCGCLRAMALRTGDQHWWDKYQACTG